jgi:hypothetical protein
VNTFRFRFAALVAMTTFTATATFDCAAPPSASVFLQTSLPDRSSFPYVGQMLAHRCGTLDCHGSMFRNLRVFGNEGLRYAATDRPLVPACTTQAEFDQDYESVVGLEPELISAVVADHGANSERLSLIRKPLGLDNHKGLTLMQPGDDTYRCLVSWLSGATDSVACLRTIPATTCLPPAPTPSDAGSE